MKKSFVEGLLIVLILIAILALSFGLARGQQLAFLFEVVLYGGYTLLLLGYMLRAKSVFYIIVLLMLMAGAAAQLLGVFGSIPGVWYLSITGMLGALVFAALLVVTAFSGKNFGLYLAAIGILVAIPPLVILLDLGLAAWKVQLIYIPLLVLIGGVKLRQSRGRVVSPEANHTLTYFLLVSFQITLGLLLAWF